MFIPKHMRPGREHGISLIELVIFIVIVSVGVAGILSVMNATSRTSADPVVRKQALAIAESLLEEIELQPFTYCDPDDANAATANSTVDCATKVEALAPEGPPSETRYALPFFDNVNDYHQFFMLPIVDITNTAVAGLGTYMATVNIAQAGTAFGIANAEALQITVNVLGPANTNITLTGYRFRYAPKALP